MPLYEVTQQSRWHNDHKIHNNIERYKWGLGDGVLYLVLLLLVPITSYLYKQLIKRTLIVGGSITVQLFSSLTGLDSVALLGTCK